MRWVPLDEVTPDMIVAEDITDESGQVLVATGQRISSNRADSLRRRGVTRAAVEDAAPPDVETSFLMPGDGGALTARAGSKDGAGGESADDPQARLVEARLARLRAMFVEHRDDALMLDLYRLACRVARGGGGE